MNLRRCAAALVLLAAAGCGSTVTGSTVAGSPAQDLGVNGQADGSGLSLPSQSAGVGDTTTPDGSSYQGTGTTAPGANGGSRTGSTPIAPSGSSAVAPPGQTRLKIGLMTFSDANTSLAATGAATTEPDFKSMDNAVIAYINKTGGVAGHPIFPAYYDVHTTDSPQATSQQACTQWTQDDHVFAVVPNASVEDNDVLRNCLARAGALGIYAEHYSSTPERDYQQAPLWFEPETLSLEAWAKVYATGLARQDFFKGSRIGVVYDQSPAYAAVTKSVLLPALRAQGANVVSTFASNIHGLGDLGSGSAQMSNAVLQFQANHVTNVVFFQEWVGWGAFTEQAESQHYHPIYGLSSQDGVQVMIETGLVPTDQLVDAKLVSWYPNVDVVPRLAGEWPRLRLCQQIYRAAHITINNNGQEGYYGALSMCGGLLNLQDAGRLSSPSVTAASLASGLERLGANLQSPDVPEARFATGRHYGAAGWRPGAYDNSCTCFKYTGPISQF